MMTLYYCPGACSMASHIALEESGAPYEGVVIELAHKEQKTEHYLKINPRGKVPVLAVDGKILTEGTAILTFIGRRFPEKKLLPSDLFDEARCISFMAWLSNTVQPAFQHFRFPERFVDATGTASVKEIGSKLTLTLWKEIDALFADKEWFIGNQFTVADCHALVFYNWGVRFNLPMQELRAYSAWKDRMLKRPAVMKILEKEKAHLLKASA